MYGVAERVFIGGDMFIYVDDAIIRCACFMCGGGLFAIALFVHKIWEAHD